MSRFNTPSGIARAAYARESGFILITGLLFLVVSTLLGVAMLRSFGLQERIAGNTRDKLRALSAAQGALQHGEWWLARGNGGSGIECAGMTDANEAKGIRVCASGLSNATALPWKTRADYLLPGMSVSAGGGTAPDGDVNYQAAPGLYISYLGFAPDGSSQLYQVTAFAYGGDPNTAAVVQSTYQTSADVKDLGGM